jgi:hypothetical protein
MNRVDVRLVGLSEESVSRQVDAVAVFVVKIEKCIRLSVLAVALRLRFLLSRVLIGLYIAAIAIRAIEVDNCI